MESLKKAYAFYQPKDGILKVVCRSWLLYPPHYEVFPDGGNLRAFYDLFTILRAREDPESKDLWRIFGQNADLSDLPDNSTLCQRFKKYLAEGNYMGNGYGILLFDGEKVLK